MNAPMVVTAIAGGQVCVRSPRKVSGLGAADKVPENEL